MARRTVAPPVDEARDMNPDSSAEHRGGRGSPLLLLHGITATFRVWEPVFPALEEQHEVIAPTLAGHHGAAALADGIVADISSLADRIEVRLDELGIARPHVAGNSLGGWIALELARRGRARTVVAFSPPAAWCSARDLTRVSALVTAGHAAARLSGPRPRGLLTRPRGRRLLLRLAAEHGDRVPPAVVEEMIRENASCTILDAFLRSIWRDGPIRGPVDVPGCPIRIAWPVRDRTVPFERFGVPLLTALPTAELVMLNGVGHVPMWDDPRLISSTILELSTSVDGHAATGVQPGG